MHCGCCALAFPLGRGCCGSFRAFLYPAMSGFLLAKHGGRQCWNQHSSDRVRTGPPPDGAGAARQMENDEGL